MLYYIVDWETSRCTHKPKVTVNKIITNELYAKVFGSTYGMEIIGLRYFNIFGPRQDPNGPYAAVIPIFIDYLKKGQDVFIDGDGEQTRDFTFVENPVQANIRAMLADKDAGMNVYNVAIGDRTSLIDMWNSLKEIADSNIEAIHGPERIGDIRDSLANIDKAIKGINYEPKFNLHNGLKLTFMWFVSNMNMTKVK